MVVDVSCGVGDLIWHRVSDFFGHDLELIPDKTVNTVILFAFGEFLHTDFVSISVIVEVSPRELNAI